MVSDGQRAGWFPNHKRLRCPTCGAVLMSFGTEHDLSGGNHANTLREGYMRCADGHSLDLLNLQREDRGLRPYRDHDPSYYEG